MSSCDPDGGGSKTSGSTPGPDFKRQMKTSLLGSMQGEKAAPTCAIAGSSRKMEALGGTMYRMGAGVLCFNTLNTAGALEMFKKLVAETMIS